MMPVDPRRADSLGSSLDFVARSMPNVKQPAIRHPIRPHGTQKRVNTGKDTVEKPLSGTCGTAIREARRVSLFDEDRDQR
jgi:hypothetical protein